MALEIRDKINFFMNRRGSLILSGLVALIIVAIGALIVSQSLRNTKGRVPFDQALQARLYATELLELFRAHTNATLRTYLSTNPVNAMLAPYPLCAQINLVNRATRTIINSDPIATLPALIADINIIPSVNNTQPAMNRFYQVQVIDIVTMAINKNVCNFNALTMGALGANERFLVSVGVTWYPPQSVNIERVILTTVLPS